MTEDQLEKMRACARWPESDAKSVRVACTDGESQDDSRSKLLDVYRAGRIKADGRAVT
jgi:hypothetical protein